eukprot:5269953-Pleurochrysis_carterae.AAC.1
MRVELLAPLRGRAHAHVRAHVHVRSFLRARARAPAHGLGHKARRHASAPPRQQRRRASARRPSLRLDPVLFPFYS